jgi:hypothetical protein|tara:strand:- start:796 stop:1038 length:243 start_codon:yes stop_codon:yes gene_type:complete
MVSQYTFDLEVESWELRVVVSVSGGYIPASMEEPAECPEIEWYIEKVLSIGSFDDIDDDDILTAVCNELDELNELAEIDV